MPHEVSGLRKVEIIQRVEHSHLPVRRTTMIQIAWGFRAAKGPICQSGRSGRTIKIAAAKIRPSLISASLRTARAKR